MREQRKDDTYVRKCRGLFLANFDPLPLSHFVTHPGTPENTSHISDPPIFRRPSTKTRTKALLYKFCLNCSQRFLSGRFCPGWLLYVPVLSEYICYIRKLNIALNFMFRMYDKKFFISVRSHALYPLPLSQTITPSRPPPPLERDVLYGRPLTPSPCVRI